MQADEEPQVGGRATTEEAAYAAVDERLALHPAGLGQIRQRAQPALPRFPVPLQRPADALGLEQARQQVIEQRVLAQARRAPIHPSGHQRIVRGRFDPGLAEQGQRELHAAVVGGAQAEHQPLGQVGTPGGGPVGEHRQDEVDVVVGAAPPGREVAPVQPGRHGRRTTQAAGAGHPQADPIAGQAVVPPVDAAQFLQQPRQPGRDLPAALVAQRPDPLGQPVGAPRLDQLPDLAPVIIHAWGH